MKFFKVTTEKFSGYDCDGHFVPHIVVADTAMDAVIAMMVEMNEDFDITKFKVEINPKDGWVNINFIDEDDVFASIPEKRVWSVNEFNMPDLNKVKKPFIVF